MRRRTLLTLAGATIGASAGCVDVAPTADPDPAGSLLRLRVENADDQTHDVRFTLSTLTEGVTNIEGFELTEIKSGATRTREPQELAAGEYELDIELPAEMSTSVVWAGYACPIKDVEIQIRADGFQVRDQCLES